MEEVAQLAEQLLNPRSRLNIDSLLVSLIEVYFPVNVIDVIRFCFFKKTVFNLFRFGIETS